MSYIDQQIQQKVATLIGWNVEEINDYIYKTGVNYLSDYIPRYPLIINQITKSKLFWAWWSKHWQNRDQQFLEVHECGEFNRVECLDEYLEIHDYRTLVEAVYLNGKVLEETYAEMIGQILKEQTKKELTHA